ncbi:MAG: hypothetical protein ABWK05_08755 [Pyrobaculum sp.]
MATVENVETIFSHGEKEEARVGEIERRKTVVKCKTLRVVVAKTLLPNHYNPPVSG